MHADIGALRDGYECSAQIVQSKLYAAGLCYHVGPRPRVHNVSAAAIRRENVGRVPQGAPRHQQLTYEITHRQVQWSTSLGTARWQSDHAFAEINFVPAQCRRLPSAEAGEQEQ